MGRFAAISEAPPACSFGRYLNGLPVEDSDELVALMGRCDAAGRHVYGGRAIRQLVRDADGVSIDRQTITAHRDGRCACRATS